MRNQRRRFGSCSTFCRYGEYFTRLRGEGNDFRVRPSLALFRFRRPALPSGAGAGPHRRDDLPVLYLSGPIVRSKSRYYELLQSVRDRGTWEEWVLYILDAAHTTP